MRISLGTRTYKMMVIVVDGKSGALERSQAPASAGACRTLRRPRASAGAPRILQLRMRGGNGGPPLEDVGRFHEQGSLSGHQWGAKVMIFVGVSFDFCWGLFQGVSTLGVLLRGVFDRSRTEYEVEAGGPHVGYVYKVYTALRAVGTILAGSFGEFPKVGSPFAYEASFLRRHKN